VNPRISVAGTRYPSKRYRRAKPAHGTTVEVKRIEAGFFDRKSSVTIRGVAALHLHTDLSQLALPRLMPRVGMDADKIVALVVWRRFVRQDVSTHEVAHHEEL